MELAIKTLHDQAALPVKTGDVARRHRQTKGLHDPAA
jgi:hypothetical protein